jgi:hypothetical protein
MLPVLTAAPSRGPRQEAHAEAIKRHPLAPAEEALQGQGKVFEEELLVKC